MTIDEDTLISYALGHLTPAEEAAVEAHLRAHPDDAATVAAYLDGLADLVMALTPEPLPANAEADLLAQLRTKPAEADLPPVVTVPKRAPEKARRGSGAAWWLGALAAAAAAAVLYVTVLTPPDPNAELAQELQRYQSQPGAVSYTLAAEGRNEPLGTLVRLEDGRVFVALAEPPGNEQVYQAWEIAEAPVSLGTFAGRAFLSSAPVAQGNTFGLTLEPPGGSEQPTSTPLTLVKL